MRGYRDGDVVWKEAGMSEWQDISTAPHDEPFLACEGWKQRVCALVHYDEWTRTIPGRWPWSPRDTVVMREEGYYLVGVTYDDECRWGTLTLRDDFNPTHWMPLPAPPDNPS